MQSLKSIWLTVHDLQPEQIFHQIMNLTLTFDPMTLTSLKILALIDVYPHTNLGFNLTDHKWDIDKNIRLLPTDGPTDGRTDQRNNS